MLPIIRYTLFAVLIAAQVLTVIGVLSSARINAESVMHEHARVVMQNRGENAIDNTRRFLVPAERSAQLTRQLISQGVLPTETTDSLERYFLAQLENNSQLAGIYLARPDGQFLMVKRQKDGFLTKTIRTSATRSVELVNRDAGLKLISRTTDPSDRYDPRTRPWYKDALGAHKLIWTGPYVFFTSRTPGITTAVPVQRPDGSVSGVVGVDIEISGLSEFMEHVLISKHGAALIMDHQGRAISVPGLESALQKTGQASALPLVSSIGNDEVRALLEQPAPAQGKNDLLAFNVGRTPTYGMLIPFKVGDDMTWKIGIHAPAEDFNGTIDAFDRTLVLNVLGIGLLTCLLAVPIAFGLTRPLNALHRQATVDQLTGLLNRPEFLLQAERLIHQARKQGQPVTVALLDLDGFKAVNDCHGHKAGDEVLTLVAQRIRAAVRDHDLVGRIGGDEFALVMPGFGAAEALILSERVRASIGLQPINSRSGQHLLGATIGIATVLDDSGIAQILEQADRALLRGKGSGKNRSLTYAMSN